MHNYKVNIIIIAQKRLEFRTKDGDIFQQGVKAEGEWMRWRESGTLQLIEGRKA